MRRTPSVSTIVPSYNACAYLRRTLETLAEEAPGGEVIVVDGQSSDGLAEMVRRHFPGCRLVERDNHGFAHAVNRGIEVANGDMLLLLNSDLFVTRVAVRAMVQRLVERPSTGAVAPTLLNPDGTRQRVFGRLYWPNYVPVRGPIRVPVLSAACLMTRRDVIAKLGAFDENLFLYNEELDWCARARTAGYALELLPDPVVHVGGASMCHSANLEHELRRGFLYVAHKHHWPIAAVTRWLVAFEGFSKSRLDRRDDYRRMWARVEALAVRGQYLDTPFPLSGRGTPSVLACADPLGSVRAA